MPKTTFAPLGVRNPELEAAILSEPDRDEPYLVYADWLQAQGDVRGELGALQHVAATAGPAGEKAKRHARALLKEHAGYVLGPLAGLDKYVLKLTWARGFLATAELEAGYGMQIQPPMDVVARLGELLAHPSAFALRGLKFGEVGRDETDYTPIVELIAAAPRPALAELSFGRQGLGATLGEAGALWPRCPRLRSVYLEAELDLGELRLPELRRFTVDSRNLGPVNTRAIASAYWPHLEELSVRFGLDETTEVADLQPILDARGLPDLTALALHEFPDPDALCAALATSPLAGQLVSLDLMIGTMTDEGAHALAARPGGWPKLERLLVAYNDISKVGRKALATLCPTVNSLPQ